MKHDFAAILSFALGAALGITMLIYLLQGKHIPKGLAILHAPPVVLGLLLLVIYSFRAGDGVWLPIVIFVIAAIGGAILFYKDVTGRAPRWLGLVHGIAAVTGFALLLFYAFSRL